MLGSLNSDAAVSSDCHGADVMHLQGVRKLVKGMQNLPLGAMQVEGLDVPVEELNFAGFE